MRRRRRLKGRIDEVEPSTWRRLEFANLARIVWRNWSKLPHGRGHLFEERHFGIVRTLAGLRLEQLELSLGLQLEQGRGLVAEAQVVWLDGRQVGGV